MSSHSSHPQPALELKNSTQLERASPALDHHDPTKPQARLHFFHPHNANKRTAYFKRFLPGCLSLILAMLAYFSIFWGALWKTPVGHLDGWVIDFDGGLVGNTVSEAMTSPQIAQQGRMTWTVVPASQFPNGVSDVANAVREQHGWAAVTINPGTSERLQTSLRSPNTTYRGSEAITLYAAEARNENAYRVLIRPSAEAALRQITQQFAIETALQIDSNLNLTRLLRESPQTLTAPISYTIDNVVPFDIPVASAVTFVGLIFQLIISFFAVVLNASAREESGLERSLNLRSLILFRLITTSVAYFFLSMFYSLISLAFQVDFTRKFGSAGFVIFWMLNWVGMLAVGLALESLYTLLRVRFMPFFLLFWIITNVSVSLFPIEVLPSIFRYGYVFPFYNLSHAVRCILFGTKNTVGVNFAALIAWVAISCVTLPVLQWLVGRKGDTNGPESD